MIQPQSILTALFSPKLIDAVGLFGKKQYDQAESVLRLYIATHPEDINGHEWFVSCLIKQDKTLEAVTHATNVLRSNPKKHIVDFYLNAVMEHVDTLDHPAARKFLAAQREFLKETRIPLYPHHREFLAELSSKVAVRRTPETVKFKATPAEPE